MAFSITGHDKDNYEYDEEAENNFIANSVAVLNNLRDASQQQQQNQQQTATFARQIEIHDHQQRLPSTKNWEIDLIEEVRSYECLWNTKCRAFKETPKKIEAWRQISAKLNVEMKLVISTWDKFRENFRKALNRRKKSSKSGSAGGNPAPTCKYFGELSFLNDVIGVRNTQSNIQRRDLFTPPAFPILSTGSACNISPHIQVEEGSAMHTPDLVSGASLQTMQTPNLRPSTSKKRKSQDSSVQGLLERAIEADLAKSKEKEEEPDEDELFCKSLVKSFKGLSKKKNKQAKIRVLEILMELESDD